MKLLTTLIIAAVLASISFKVIGFGGKVNDTVDGLYGEGSIHDCAAKMHEYNLIPTYTPEDRQAKADFAKGCEDLLN